MKTSSLFNEDFNEHLSAVSPNAKNWLEGETTDAVDVEAAAKAAGLLIHKASFKELSKSDLRFERRQDDGSYLDHDVLFINSDFNENHQRWEIAHMIGRLMVQQSCQEPDESEAVVTEFNELGQEQSLPQPVYDFFVGHRFSPMSEDALANMVIALDNTQIPEIKDWWRQSNSEARLANAYFHGFLSDANLPEIIRISHDVDFITALKYATNFDVEEVVADEDEDDEPESALRYLIMVRDKRVKPQRLLGFISADYEEYYGDYDVDEVHVVTNPDMASVFLDEDDAEAIKRGIKLDVYSLSDTMVSDVKLTVVTY